MSYFLGIDIGTYSSKGVLVDGDGQIVGRHDASHELSMPRPGWAEHDADAVWWRDFTAICRALLSESGVEAADIAAVGTSGIAPCVLPLSEDGRPLHPAILYGIDTRATAEIDELNAELGADWILERTGSELSAQSAGPKILWIKHNEPEVWRSARFFVTSTSYLVYRLTGRRAIDHYTAAFCGPLYDIAARRWSQAGCAPVCRPDQLAEPMWTTDVAGHVTAEAAAVTGLAEGTPVIAGTADAASEAVSAGVMSPGDTMVMYGSSVFIIRVFADQPHGGVFWPAPFLFPGTFALAAGMSTTGAITQWFRRELGAAEVATEEAGGRNAYEALAAAAAEVAPGAEGLVALPYFSGERTPLNDPNARGVVAGLTLSHTRAHLYRALLEGVALGVRHNLEEMAGAAGTAGVAEKPGAAARTDGDLVAIGGGTANSLWMQIIADALGRSHIVRSSPGASYGDAALAAVGVGALGREDIVAWVPDGEVVAPDDGAAAVYRRLYPLYRNLYADSAETVHAIAATAREE